MGTQCPPINGYEMTTLSSTEMRLERCKAIALFCTTITNNLVIKDYVIEYHNLLNQFEDFRNNPPIDDTKFVHQCNGVYCETSDIHFGVHGTTYHISLDYRVKYVNLSYLASFHVWEVPNTDLVDMLLVSQHKAFAFRGKLTITKHN